MVRAADPAAVVGIDDHVGVVDQLVTGIPWVVGLLEIGEDLTHHPVKAIDHAGIVGIGLALFPLVDDPGVGREFIAHPFQVLLEARAVAGGNRTMDQVRAEVQEERLVLVLANEPDSQVGRLVERASVFVELIGVVGSGGGKIGEAIGLGPGPGPEEPVFYVALNPELGIVVVLVNPVFFREPEIKSLVQGERIPGRLAAHVPLADMAADITGLLQHFRNGRFILGQTVNVIRGNVADIIAVAPRNDPAHHVVHAGMGRVLPAQKSRPRRRTGRRRGIGLGEPSAVLR